MITPESELDTLTRRKNESELRMKNFARLMRGELTPEQYAAEMAVVLPVRMRPAQ